MNLSDVVSQDGLFRDGDWIEKKDQNPNGAVRLIQLADIGVCRFKNKSARYITEDKGSELNCTYLQKGDILIARLPEPLGRACIFPLEGKYITAVDIAIVRILRKDINPKYVMYMINSPQFRNEIKKYESGTTRKRISRKNLDRIEFDIPSISEQERIVSRIEELFSQLDSGMETLKRVKPQLAVYRQAVLKEAYNKYCDFVPLGQISERIFDGPFGSHLKSADYTNKGVRVVRLENIKSGWFDASKQSYVSLEKYETICAHTVFPSDLIMSTFISESIKVCQLPLSIEFAVNKADCVGIRLNEDIQSKFIMFYLLSRQPYTALIHQVHGATRPRINTKQIKAILVPYANGDMQKETITEIERKLSIYDRIEQTVDTALQQAEAMQQSILKKAFEGGL